MTDVNKVIKDRRQLVYDLKKKSDKFTKKQHDVVMILTEPRTVDTFPYDFFEKRSVDELNRHFGANTELKVDETVRDYMIMFMQYLEILDDMVGYRRG